MLLELDLPRRGRAPGFRAIHFSLCPMASRDALGVAGQADREAVAFRGTGRRLARAAYGLGFRFRV